MSNTKTVMGQAANTQGIPLDITDVFSTYLYEGTGSAQTITNGIDLDGEGGLVWIKNRDFEFDNTLVFKDGSDTLKYLNSASTSAAVGTLGWFSSFNSDGFSITSGEDKVNYSASGYNDYASWTFRKAPKFFDVVTYTGNGGNLTIDHNLGSVPGCIIIKCTSAVKSWVVYHRGVNGGSNPENYALFLNSTGAQNDNLYFQDTAPTSTQFFLGDSAANENGQTHVAYLFAHNDGDGGFGPDGDQDIIKCGSYTGGGSSDVDVDLGFEPQFVLVKGADIARGWVMGDIMRGAPVGSNGQRLFANTSDAETTEDTVFTPTPTGFKVKANTGGTVNDSGLDYIYIAIRRGPLAPPESATEVFDMSYNGQGDPNTPPKYETTTMSYVDMGISTNITGSGRKVGDRLRQGKELRTDSSNAEGNEANHNFDYQGGYFTGTGTSTDSRAWMWKRAPGFFDVVAYTGNGTAGRTVSHNLGVAPEMMWVKGRDVVDHWHVYHAATTADNYLRLNDSGSATDSVTVWNDTDPTSSVFTVGNNGGVNGSGDTYIAYLFASLPGISKVGSYTGNGTSQTIDCGFTSGARFVLIKNTDASDSWILFDSARGIVAGNDPYLFLNHTYAEGSSLDLIDPYSAGFEIVSGDATMNTSGQEYIFYAIA